MIADDNALIRDGIRSLLKPWPELRVVEEAATGLEALQRARSATPDIAIIDLSLPDLRGVDLILALKRELPRTHVLVYTIHRSEELVDEAMRAGASGYVVKGDQSSDLLAALMNCR
ncbi:MAG: response regulator transcription factor [Allosphingosinicella sp.]